MSQVFVWIPATPANTGPHDPAAERFRAALDALRSRHEHVFRRPFTARSLRFGDAWIGQVDTDQGIAGWAPWVDRDGRGVAWSGVCEAFLGRTDLDAVAEEVCRTVFERPAEVAEWPGAFSVVAWDRSRGGLAVLTSAAEPQPLWETRGPAGWAVGSRAKPLLDLVGRSAELDEVQASLFLSFGYLAGEGSLFRGVDRMPARRKISVRNGDSPRGETYLSTAGFFEQGDTRGLGLEDAIATTGDRFAARVATQLRHSPNPMLSVTGGRDSRAVAAALSAAGYPGPAQTGGATDSPDVRVAANVARILGFEHRTGGGGADMLERMVGGPNRALEWTGLTEGIETVRHALHFPALLQDPDASDLQVFQTFNGLNPGLRAPEPKKWGRDAALSKVEPALRASAAALEHMTSVVDRLEREVLDAGGDAGDVPEMFYWQSRALVWGMDNVASKFGMSLWWTPLMDASLVRASWWLPREAKPPKAFVEGLATYLAPRLQDVPYENVGRPSLVETYVRRIRRRLAWLLGPSSRQPFRSGPERGERWDAFLFEREPRVWPDLIAEDHVRSVLESNPNANLLWSIATLELFAEAHL